MADVKLFLSCVSDEFRAYREALRHALTHKRVEIKIQEDFNLPGGDTLAMLEDYIESCDVVVHFIGGMAGSAPPATSVDDLLKRRPELAPRLADKGMTREDLGGLTYTQWEAWLAVGFNKDGANGISSSSRLRRVWSATRNSTQRRLRGLRKLSTCAASRRLTCTRARPSQAPTIWRFKSSHRQCSTPP